MRNRELYYLRKPGTQFPHSYIVWEFQEIRGTLFWGPSNRDPTV